MKSKKLLSVVMSALLCVSLAGCATSSESKDDKIIKVGATLVPGGELLEKLKPLIEEKGYEIARRLDALAERQPPLSKEEMDREAEKIINEGLGRHWKTQNVFSETSSAS